MHRARILVCSTLASLVLTACGGANPTPIALPAPQKTAAQDVTFSITVPAATQSSARRPAYVSSATASASIAVNGGSSVTVNCTSVCSGTIAAPIGADTFTAKLYDAQNGFGHLLSTGSLPFTVVAGTANSVNLTFNPVVASLALTVAAGAKAGTGSVHAVTLQAFDAAGKLIIGPGVFVDSLGTPIDVTLSDSDNSGATTLSTSRITAPGTSIDLTYTGKAIAPATITASASGIAPASASFAPALQPIAVAPSSLAFLAAGSADAQSVTPAEPGYTGSFSLSSATCTGVATYAASVAAGSPASIVPVAAGSCSITFTDAFGQTAALPVGITTTSITGQ